MSVQSLASMAEATLLDNLKQSLNTNIRSATYACGGSVQFHKEEGPQQQLSEDPTPVYSGATTNTISLDEIEPVQVRFGKSGEGVNIVFSHEADKPNAELEQLVSACQPATFGRGGDDIMDEVRILSTLIPHTSFDTRVL